MKKQKALLGTLAAFVVLGAGNVAMAGTNYPSRISMGYSSSSGGSFAGSVGSSAKCRGGRTVSIYRTSPGADPSIGSTRTSSSGSWGMVTGKPRRGDYYAQVSPKSAGAGVRCGGARTATTHVS